MSDAGWGGFDASAPGFSGVPPEVRERVERVLDREPVTLRDADELAPFDQQPPDRRPLSFRTMLGAHKVGIGAALLLIVVEAAMSQAGPLLMQVAIDRGISAGEPDVVTRMGLIFLATVVVGTLAGAGRHAVAGRVGSRMLFELRVRLFSHFQRLSLDYFTGERAGRLISRMTSDLESLQQLFNEGFVQLAVQALTVLVVTVVLFLLSPVLALITLAIVLPVTSGLTLWFRRESDVAFAAVRDRIADVVAHLQETLAGIRTVTIFNRREREVDNHRREAGVYLDANDRTADLNAVYGPSTETLGSVSQVLLLIVGGGMVLGGSLTIGELAAFLLYVTAFFAPIQQLVQLFGAYQKGRASVVKIGSVLAADPSVPEAPDAYDLPPIQGAIRLEHVDFAYEPGVPVLSDVDLDIAPGEVIAVVGPTGAGKSTIAKLITRFYDPTAGRVTIDGHDLREVTFRSLRSQLGVVPQEPFLFSGSIRDNVAFARPDATEAEIRGACDAVGLRPMLERLPEGLDTPCRERGLSLSTGERQLLALARAFLAQPRVLVLDEATSSLDLRSEAIIEHALDVVLEGRTAIVIAHRLATAERADRIAVVDDGRIVELGTREQLLAQDGRFAAMWRTWDAA